MTMRLERKRYLNRLINLKHNGLVKVITGIRRCGKSYLLFQLFKEHLVAEGVDESHIVEIQLDDERYRDCRNPIRLAEYVRSRIPNDGGCSYILIDEIQLCRKVLEPGVKISEVAPEDRQFAYVTFYDVLNELMKRPLTDVYVTGSNSKMLSNDVATNFRGRGVEVRLHPLSFAECLEASSDDKATAWEKYLVWGGMPMAVLESDDNLRSAYLKDQFSQVFLRDICERYGLKGDHVLDKVADVLCSSIGSLTNPNRLLNTLKSVLGVQCGYVTVKKYLDYLLDSFLFSRALRYDVKGRHYMDYPEKYYAEDLGLRNAKLNFRQTEKSHLMENAIYNELVMRGCNVDVGVVNALEDKGGKHAGCQYEIDFVVNLGVNKVYVQSAFEISNEEKMKLEKRSLCKSGDFFRKIIVQNGFQPPLQDEDGIVHVGVVPFLLQENVLLG